MRRLERDARTFNTDYIGTGSFSSRRINRERTGSGDSQEITWSAGETLSADAVLKAFKLAPEKSAALQRDALPSSGNAASLLAKLFFWGFVVVVLLMLFRCDGGERDCSQVRATYGEASAEYQNCLRSAGSSGGRTGGGSWGGWSSGGGGSHRSSTSGSTRRIDGMYAAPRLCQRGRKRCRGRERSALTAPPGLRTLRP